jgi:hypothetical protein
MSCGGICAGRSSHNPMNDSPPSPSANPVPMEGHGLYNLSSRVQAAGLSPAVPLFEKAAMVTTLPPEPDPIVIADYGSSEGRNSLGPIAVAIRALRERVGSNRGISVIHTDLADNDFSALFRTLTNDPNSYLQGDSEVFPAAVGRSFYQQILLGAERLPLLGWFPSDHQCASHCRRILLQRHRVQIRFWSDPVEPSGLDALVVDFFA